MSKKKDPYATPPLAGWDRFNATVKERILYGRKQGPAEVNALGDITLLGIQKMDTKKEDQYTVKEIKFKLVLYGYWKPALL